MENGLEQNTGFKSCPNYISGIEFMPDGKEILFWWRSYENNYTKKNWINQCQLQVCSIAIK